MKKVVDNSKDIVKSKDYQLQSNDISNGIYSCSAIARKLIAFCISNAYDDEIELTNVFADEELAELTSERTNNLRGFPEKLWSEFHI